MFILPASDGHDMIKIVVDEPFVVTSKTYRDSFE